MDGGGIDLGCGGWSGMALGGKFRLVDDLWVVVGLWVVLVWILNLDFNLDFRLRISTPVVIHNNNNYMERVRRRRRRRSV